MADDVDYDRENDDNINYKSISCEQIPELFLDKLVAKNHFSKFGKINRFILRPNRLCCTVDYETEEDAANAYENAGEFNGKEFIVNYAEKEVGHVQNTEEWVDPDVQAELDAMGRNITASGMRAPMPIMKPPLPLPVTKRTVKPAMLSKVSKSSLPPPTPQAALEPATVTLPKVDTAMRMELEAILRKPALTEEEKYRVLDARDKLIRLTTVRQTDIKKAVSTKGICPDMCPEKERLMREFQRQVSTFEMYDAATNFAINHRRAIKEYSRSSADQEVPLAHELRPETVLKMTMLYLMHNILDLCDDPQTSIADWFHFVWDRTRSIRKDITQQELCSLGAVQLVEQCARFHIHCAARLVAEDPSVFDKKINAENLTKCLQTLKYMYHDLRIKHVRCPREAEFRSYIVLLNLGDANFLWELKQLPEEIQKSVEIKRAIAFYNALQNNNFVRFFDLIRSPETSYLSACILLGYFTKLRVKAMEAIVKSHNWRKTAVSLPLKYLVRVLGFESEDTAMDFFNSHGMQCNEDQVTLDRVKMPDMEYTMDRAMLLVESKRTTSVGECVNGQALDSPAIFEKHEPHNSFDGNGFLKPEAWTADDQLRGEAAAAKKLQKQATQSQVSSTTTRTSDNIFKVPLTTPSISPKQQQLKQQQQDLFGNKTIAPTIASTTASIFGGNYFGGDLNKTEFSTPKSTTAPIFSTKPVNNSMNIFSSGAPTSDSGESIFKVPLPSSSNAVNKQKPTEVSSSNTFFNSIFKSNKEQTTGAGIFGGFTNADNKPLVDTGGSDNIFGSAAKETANIFQQKSAAQIPTVNEPKPLQTDNVFKHFSTTGPAFGTGTAVGGVTTGTSIFGTAAAAITTEQQRKAELDAKKLEEARERKRQLEEEERKQLAALEKERQKLRELEEKQRQEQERKRKAEAEERKVAERQRRLLALGEKAEAETQLQLELLLTGEIRHIANTELDLYQTIEYLSQELTAQLIDEFVAAEVSEIQHEEYGLMCHDQMILQRYFERWLQSTRRRIEQRKLLQSTPIWVTTQTRAQRTQQLQHPREAENLQMIKRYRFGEACDFKQLLAVLSGSTQYPPIDLFKIFAKYATQREPERNGRKYFKLLLTLPGEMEEMPGFNFMCNRWLQKYLPSQQPQQNNDAGAYINACKDNVALCVRKITGTVPITEMGQRVRSECDHADGIIFLMTADNMRNTRRRLHHLLKLSKLNKPLPLAVVVYNAINLDERQLESYLELDNFIDECRISNFKILGCLAAKNDFDFYGNLRSAARFVARESSGNNTEAEALEMQSLHSWFELALGEEMWQRWHTSELNNPIFAKICSMPQFVVALYNEALQRLREIVAEDMQEVPEFPVELREHVPVLKHDIKVGLEYFPQDWKCAKRSEQLVKFLQDIALPTFDEQQLLVEDIEQFELFMLNYASRCIPHDDLAATQVSYQAIKLLIELLNNEDTTQQPKDFSARLTTVSWLQVIKSYAFGIIQNKLEIMCRGKTLPKEIIYRRQAFDDYQQLPWWLNFEPLNAVTVDYSLEDGMETHDDSAQATAEDVDAVIVQATATARKAEKQMRMLKLRNATSKPLHDELTRELDESFFQFELAKKCGTYSLAYKAAILQDDDDFEELQNEIAPKGKKRRRVDEHTTEVDAIMAKAFALIEKVETKQEQREKTWNKLPVGKQS